MTDISKEACEAAAEEMWRAGYDDIRDIITTLRAALDAAEAERDRCHVRLEIDHYFTLSDDETTERCDIPLDMRASFPDGIECRDATIDLQDAHIKELETENTALRAQLAGAVDLIPAFPNVDIVESDDPSATAKDWYLNGWQSAKRAMLEAIRSLPTPAPNRTAPDLADTPDYDAGLLNAYGGGDVDWWQDYLRAEIGRANDHWRAALALLGEA